MYAKEKLVSEIEKSVVLDEDVILEGYLNERILLFQVYHCAAPKHGIVSTWSKLTSFF